MPTTPNFAIPYDVITGAPDGHAEGQAIAERLDVVLLGLATGYRYLTTAYFTAGGTFVSADYPGIVGCYARCQGSGAGAAGAAITAAGEWSFGDGGGGGEYAEGWIPVGSLGATQTVTIGAGGTGGAGADGSNGAVTSLGALLTANGGSGGRIRAATSTLSYGTNLGRSGGTGGTGGDVRVPGSPGRFGLGVNSTSTGVRAGDGGHSVLGTGGMAGSNANGNPGGGYGGGGGGAANSASQGSARTGGAGTDGILIAHIYVDS